MFLIRENLRPDVEYWDFYDWFSGIIGTLLLHFSIRGVLNPKKTLCKDSFYGFSQIFLTHGPIKTLKFEIYVT